MICKDEVRSALLCVHDFVRSPHFTQGCFFSDSGIAMLAESAATCDSITNGAVFEPRSHVETASCSQVVAVVCVNQAVDRRRAVKDSQEQWYAVGGIRPSSEGSASRSGVRISKRRDELNTFLSELLQLVFVAPAICVFPRGNPKRGKSVEVL